VAGSNSCRGMMMTVHRMLAVKREGNKSTVLQNISRTYGYETDLSGSGYGQVNTGVILHFS
jgi:hypothetical protein